MTENTRNRDQIKTEVQDPEEENQYILECRACLQILNTSSVLHNMFEKWMSPWDGMENSIAEDLTKLTGIQISEADNYSKIICGTCCKLLKKACQFTAIVQKNDLLLKQRLPEDAMKFGPINENDWSEPVKVDKSLVPSMYENPIEVEIKQEVLDTIEINNAYEEDLQNFDIKVEPEEIQQDPLPMKMAFTMSIDPIVNDICYNKNVCCDCNETFDTFAQLTAHKQKCKAAESKEMTRVKIFDDAGRFRSSMERNTGDSSHEDRKRKRRKDTTVQSTDFSDNAKKKRSISSVLPMETSDYSDEKEKRREHRKRLQNRERCRRYRERIKKEERNKATALSITDSSDDCIKKLEETRRKNREKSKRYRDRKRLLKLQAQKIPNRQKLSHLIHNSQSAGPSMTDVIYPPTDSNNSNSLLLSLEETVLQSEPASN